MEDVGIHIRVSTDEQIVEEKFGLGIQLEEIKEYCIKKRYTIVEIYEDAGISGAEQNRPALNKLLEDTKDKNSKKLLLQNTIG